MDARLETNVPKTTISYGSSAEELVAGAVNHFAMEIELSIKIKLCMYYSEIEAMRRGDCRLT